MVICLERGTDLHMAQLMPLQLTVSCFSKIQIGFTFLVLAHLGRPGKRAVNRVCVCVQERACPSTIPKKCPIQRGIRALAEYMVPWAHTSPLPITASQLAQSAHGCVHRHTDRQTGQQIYWSTIIHIANQYWYTHVSHSHSCTQYMLTKFSRCQHSARSCCVKSAPSFHGLTGWAEKRTVFDSW